MDIQPEFANPPTADLFTRLPNEVLQLILSHLEVHQLIHLRLVCARWQAIIETMHHSSRSLALIHNYYEKDKESLINKRFFGQIDLNDFEILKLKPIKNNAELDAELDEEFDAELGAELFKALLQRMFPMIEQLIFSVEYFLKLPNILLLWPTEQIVTLSITGLEEGWFWWAGANTETECEEIQLDLANDINSLVALRRLDLDGPQLNFFTQLDPTFGRIEHFSFDGDYVSEDDDFSEIIAHLGAQCTRFWIDDSLTSASIRTWHSLNSQWLSSVTHLHLRATQLTLGNSETNEIDDLFAYFANYSTSLEVLDLGSFDEINLLPKSLGLLAPLTHLIELNLEEISAKVEDWDKVDVRISSLVKLRSVQVCKIVIRKGTNTEADLNLMKCALSVLLPNVQCLNVELAKY